MYTKNLRLFNISLYFIEKKVCVFNMSFRFETIKSTVCYVSIYPIAVLDRQPSLDIVTQVKNRPISESSSNPVSEIPGPANSAP